MTKLIIVRIIIEHFAHRLYYWYPTTCESERPSQHSTHTYYASLGSHQHASKPGKEPTIYHVRHGGNYLLAAVSIYK